MSTAMYLPVLESKRRFSAESLALFLGMSPLVIRAGVADALRQSTDFVWFNSVGTETLPEGQMACARLDAGGLLFCVAFVCLGSHDEIAARRNLKHLEGLRSGDIDGQDYNAVYLVEYAAAKPGGLQ